MLIIIFTTKIGGSPARSVVAAGRRGGGGGEGMEVGSSNRNSVIVLFTLPDEREKYNGLRI
jgi:hypothetical protein